MVNVEIVANAVLYVYVCVYYICFHKMYLGNCQLVLVAPSKMKQRQIIHLHTHKERERETLYEMYSGHIWDA